MFYETYINWFIKLYDWDVTGQSSLSGNNKDNNIEAAAASQLQMSKIDSKNKDSLQAIPEFLSHTTLYDHHKIVPISSDSIEKIY